MIAPINQDLPIETKSSRHLPVMSDEILQYLNQQQNMIIVDGTMGMGGHAQVILKQLNGQCLYVGLDRDNQSLSVAKDNLKKYESSCRFVHENFRNINKVLEDLKIECVDFILLDLGISSYQLDNATRGFSFRQEGPLDMRMDQESFISAFDLINTLSERELSNIIKDFGEERWHSRIARHLVTLREKNPINTTKELSEIILRAIPSVRTREKIHPATRTFQAFRIAVNRELESLELALEYCARLLKVGGRIAVISFHSLEDRIVKERFKSLSQLGEVKILTKKPLRPTDEESSHNSRSRSARLRVAERI